MDINDQSIKQKKIMLAQSEHASAIVELLKDCRTEVMSVVADTEFGTIVNALRLEFEANLIQRVAIYIEEIKEGKLHEPK